MDNSYFAVTWDTGRYKFIFVFEYKLENGVTSKYFRALPFKEKVSFENSNYYPIGSHDFNQAVKWKKEVQKLSEKAKISYQGIDGTVSPNDIRIKEIDCLFDNKN